MKNISKYLFVLIFCLLFSCGDRAGRYRPEISGEPTQWHKVVLTFEGPAVSETDPDNPFLNYRMEATFKKQDKIYKVPGFYAADGNAAETGAAEGNRWKVIFCPDDFGIWNYRISFRKGKDIAVDENPDSGKKVFFDGYVGLLTILPGDKTGKDFRARGRLTYAGEHYLRYSGTGEYFIKGGADSPENLLGYADFDGTYVGGDTIQRPGEAKPFRSLHTYQPHIRDWNEGDPTWKGDKGKGIIGALNYLSSKGMNSVYMLTNNVEGDGRDVFPWINYMGDFTRFDVSKLEQWEIVFSHMDKLGLMCHFVTQETENQLLLDGGDLGLVRKLYYRELIARFSHHLGITWNLGEENGVSSWQPNGQNDSQRKDMAKFFKENDPYKNLVVVHTHIGTEDRRRTLDSLLGYPYLDGPSLQTDPDKVFDETLWWRTNSAKMGKKWVVTSDEIGPADKGALPDIIDPGHDEIRREVLWGNLMAGGAGVEWYFGYKYPHNDLNCEDWRSRDKLWDQTRAAIDFFQLNLPFYEMTNINDRIRGAGVYGFAKSGEVYVFYVPGPGQAEFTSDTQGHFLKKVFDPLTGQFISPADTVDLVHGMDWEIDVRAGLPVNKDRVVLLEKLNL